jgi:hypothetical protein
MNVPLLADGSAQQHQIRWTAWQTEASLPRGAHVRTGRVGAIRRQYECATMSGPPLLHGSRRSALSAAVRAFSRALSAWRDVSAAGASRAVRVANGALTLGEHAAYAPSQAPALGALAATADDAAAALDWLRASAARLRRALDGLDEHTAALRRSATESGAVLATVGGEGWVRFYDAAVECLRLDLADKIQFLACVDAVFEGTAALDREVLERGAETWLEMPRVHELTVELVAAAHDAELVACEAIEAEEAEGMLSPSCQKGGWTGCEGSPEHSTPKAARSPAMTLLLSGGTGKKKKKEKS